MAGKNMNYFLMDGSPKGRVKCTLANWTGVAYKIPRVDLVKCKDIEHLKQSGVYFLFSKDQAKKPLVYVGQAGSRKNGEGILNRLKEHHAAPKPGLEDWYEAVAFTTSNNVFGPTEISWLENKFFTLAAEVNRYEAKNGKEPTAGNVTEEKESELEEFVEYTKTTMGVLGHMVFEHEVPTPSPSALKAENIFAPAIGLELRQGDVLAFGQRTNDGFIVFKGSKIKPGVAQSCPKGAKIQRENNASSLDANSVLIDDVSLNSANEAACFVVGNSISGIQAWKTAEGKTLKEIEESEADAL